MRQPISALTQSRYYSAAFNAAIFDGPVRIYFAQYQEALALKVYFRLQDRLQGITSATETRSRHYMPNIFVMLYPTEEIFTQSFSPEQVSGKVVCEKLGEDHVVGVCGPLREEDFEQIFAQIEALAGAGASAPIAVEPLLALV